MQFHYSAWSLAVLQASYDVLALQQPTIHAQDSNSVLSTLIHCNKPLDHAKIYETHLYRWGNIVTYINVWLQNNKIPLTVQ